MKSTPGPLLEAMTHRLSRCPGEFLMKPMGVTSAGIHVGAVVGDLIFEMTGEFAAKKDLRFNSLGPEDENALNLVLIGCWLLHDAWFLDRPEYAPGVLDLLKTRFKSLAAVVTAENVVLVPERREEFARICLRALNLMPAGETAKQAEDRLKALDSVERARIVAETRKAEEHARKVREAMERKKAQKAAAKVMRE